MENIDINIKLRSEILDYSLNLEYSINNLLLLNLGIYDEGSTTRLFGNKGGLSFQQKIDLLYDINVLSKDENFDFNLLMYFRNKFLHALECNSFREVLSQMDKSLKNKFKKFFNENQGMTDEEHCLNAINNLYLRNIRCLRVKIRENINKLSDKKNLLLDILKQNDIKTDIFFGLIDKILEIFEESELEDDKIRDLCYKITNLLDEYKNKYSEAEDNDNPFKSFVSDFENIKNYFHINKMKQGKIDKEIEKLLSE